MTNLSPNKQVQRKQAGILDSSLLNTFFDLQSANIVRSKTSFSFVFLTIHPNSEFDADKDQQAHPQLGDFLSQQVRNSDLVFQWHHPHQYLVFLSFSGEIEATHFLQRLSKEVEPFFNPVDSNNQVSLAASIVEIANSHATVDEVVEAGLEALQKSLDLTPSQFQVVNHFKERDVETIKVSIIEPDPIILNIIQTILEHSSLNHFQLDIQTFQDGNQFLESTWYHSGHTHLVIMNDILPMKNGIDILHELRGLPNQQKYIILMMSKRKQEEDIIYSYEHGVDRYITKPFNPKLLEVQLKSMLRRLRL